MPAAVIAAGFPLRGPAGPLHATLLPEDTVAVRFMDGLEQSIVALEDALAVMLGVTVSTLTFTVTLLLVQPLAGSVTVSV